MNQRIITWVDVQQAILAKSNGGSLLPPGLASVRCFWDGLSLIHGPGADLAALRTWLSDAFGPAWQSDENGDKIAMVSYNGERRTLPVIWETLAEGEQVPPLAWLPLFRAPRRLPVTAPPQTDSWESSPPAMLAFHSFKGGVGRTTHALAVANILSEHGARILLVDADMEAPGISWLLASRFPSPAISLADVLALAHGDSSADYQATVDLAVQEIRKLHEDHFFFLPAFRSITQFEDLEIRPEHLLQGAANPFVLSNLLHRVGENLGVDYILVDLRAGLSELASGFLFDDRIHRIFVTTLSAQSLLGTEMLLEHILPITEKSDSAGVAVIVSQVPQTLSSDAGASSIDEMLSRIVDFLTRSTEDTPDEMPQQSQHPLIKTFFADGLAVLPKDLHGVLAAVSKSDLSSKMKTLLDWLPEKTLVSDSTQNPESATTNIDDRRKQVSEYAKRLIFAESGQTWDFLSTTPLQNLARDHSNSLPVTLIIGTKGAGKTYSYLQLSRSRTWAVFASSLTDGVGPTADANVLPVLESVNLKTSAKKEVQGAREACVTALGLKLGSKPLIDFVRDWLRLDLHEGEWREKWLDLVAWSAGFEAGIAGAGSNFPGFLRERATPLIAIIDGLEDLFQDFEDDQRQAVALRSLLQDVPNWLDRMPERVLGLIVFVRQDIVERTVKQNSAQLRALYEPYALRWNRIEALRLVAWILDKAGVSSDKFNSSSSDDVDSMEQLLRPLWGRKLGKDTGKNANSAKFVTLALSDYDGRLQARDLVRFLAEAANASIGKADWNERLLVPTAIQHAVKECGRERMGELKKENPKLGAVLDKLAAEAGTLRIPARRDELKITSEEISLLETNAVLFKDGDDYYMPEFLRQGMNLPLRGGSRPKLFSLLALRNKD